MQAQAPAVSARAPAVLRAAPRHRRSRLSAAVAPRSEATHTLYTLPVSNFGARPRLVIAWKGLSDVVRVAPPSDLGGLRGAAYLKLNPQGKMPLLLLPDGKALPESDVIVSYLLDKFADRGPSLRPGDAEARAFAALATRLHDVYLGPLQGCMYKEMLAPQRAAQLAELHRQLGVLEAALDATGPFVAGGELSAADAALFPTFVFYTLMLPRRFGWKDVFADKPRLRRWWDAMCADKHAAAVRAEMREALAGWDEAGRWDKLGITAQVADSSEHRWAY